MELKPTPSTGPVVVSIRSVDKLVIVAQELVQEASCDSLTICKSEMGYVVHLWDVFAGDAQRICPDPRLINKLLIVGVCDGAKCQDGFSHAILDFGDVVLHVHARPGENLRVDSRAPSLAERKSYGVSARTLELSITDLERLLDHNAWPEDVAQDLRAARDRLRNKLSVIEKDLANPEASA